MKRLKKVLMERDGNTEEEAKQRIAEAREVFHRRMEEGAMPFDFMQNWFGLEPDYFIDLIG